MTVNELFITSAPGFIPPPPCVYLKPLNFRISRGSLIFGFYCIFFNKFFEKFHGRVLFLSSLTPYVRINCLSWRTRGERGKMGWGGGVKNGLGRMLEQNLLTKIFFKIFIAFGKTKTFLWGKNIKNPDPCIFNQCAFLLNIIKVFCWSVLFCFSKVFFCYWILQKRANASQLSVLNDPDEQSSNFFSSFEDLIEVLFVALEKYNI